MKWIFGIFLILIFICVKNCNSDISKSEECIYKYIVKNENSGCGKLYTNETPGENGCVNTNEGIVCGNLTLKKTLKGSDRCLPLDDDGNPIKPKEKPVNISGSEKLKL